MTIEEAIYLELTGFAGLSALIGVKLYPMVIPEDVALPAVTYQLIADVPQGRSHSGTCQQDARWQFACVAATAKLSREVAAQVSAALKDFNGLLGGAGGVDASAYIANAFENFDSPTDGYVKRVDVMITY